MKFEMTPGEILAAARAPEPGDEGYDPFDAFDEAQGADHSIDPMRSTPNSWASVRSTGAACRKCWGQ